MKDIDWSLNRIITILTSAIIHAALMVGICCSATEQKEKPIEMERKLIKLNMIQPTPEPSPKPVENQTKQEEKKPAEKTKQEEPKPAEKTKQEEKKPAENKPVQPSPKVIENEKKPVTQPKKTNTDDFWERYNNAETVTVKPQSQPQPRPVPKTQQPIKTSSLGKSTDQIIKETLSGTSQTNKPIRFTPYQTGDVDKNTYAEYASQILEPYWNPSRAGMKVKNPTEVVIEFMVKSDGGVLNLRIAQQSNEPILNNSVENLLNLIRAGQIRLPPFSEIGIKNRSSLMVKIGMHLKD